ncbi:MAG: hypothetical protein JW914_08700 [Syntrophaceae bacterium]|nr:hypothetical protein [Syntrophaceae bacterium]
MAQKTTKQFIIEAQHDLRFITDPNLPRILTALINALTKADEEIQELKRQISAK